MSSRSFLRYSREREAPLRYGITFTRTYPVKVPYMRAPYDRYRP